MSPTLLSAKSRALLVHLGISAVVLCLSLAVAISAWYPGIWFQLDGGWQGIRIMALVDLVLGPLLTFVVFNPAKSKRQLIVDLSCIVAIQIAALIWGIHLIHKQQPLAIVYTDQAFYSVDRASIEKGGHSVEDLKKISEQHPMLAYCMPEQSPADAIQRLLNEFNQGIRNYEDISCYRPLEMYTEVVYENSLDITDNTALQIQLQEFLAEYPGKAAEDFAYIRFYGRYGDSILIMDKSAQIIGKLQPAAAD